MALPSLRYFSAFGTFLEELRDYSMKLHTKSQAPKEGKAAEPKNQKPVGGGWVTGWLDGCLAGAGSLLAHSPGLCWKTVLRRALTWH